MFRKIYTPKGLLFIAYLLLVLLFVSCKKDIVNNKVENQEILSSSPLLLGNFWTQLAVPDVTGTPTAIDHNYTFTVNNKLYVVIAGYNQLWEYDPSTTVWTQKQNTFYTFTSDGYAD